ncbi:apolipoprotein L6 isoform X2 [Loxodonta africana]|uniref:apolipoprotein L6 isoform X2 n=1 Tax=Loxodonta africana TaxID=9785 RepID=UPI000C81287D|nr:apolipoprotein L6 isoform X2 [Loxodonta africana]
MATETSQICKENRTTNGDTSNSAVDEMSMPLVPPKLLDIQAVEEYEAGVGLQSGKDDVLLWEDVKWTLQEDMHLSAGERTFLEKFHLLKCDLEVCISKLHALADHMDTTHETFTKTNVVDWKQMKEGERTEAAKELRAQAQDLEEVLTELTQLYESLRQKELLQEKSLLNSTFEGAMWDLPQSPVWPGEEGCQIPAGRGEAQEPLCGRPTAQVLGATS